jgi:thiosulfate reductase cytochrome b subunit
LISLPELALLGAASYRATQLGVHDTILDPARERLATWHANKLDSRPRKFLMQLISCIYCLGFWLSGAVLTAWWFWRDNLLVQFGLLWLAISGIQALLNRRDDTWTA